MRFFICLRLLNYVLKLNLDKAKYILMNMSMKIIKFIKEKSNLFTLFVSIISMVCIWFSIE